MPQPLFNCTPPTNQFEAYLKICYIGSVLAENSYKFFYRISFSGGYLFNMGIIAKKPVRDFWERHPDAKQPLENWYREVKREIWDTPHDLKAKYQQASIIGDNRVVFDIGNNQFSTDSQS